MKSIHPINKIAVVFTRNWLTTFQHWPVYTTYEQCTWVPAESSGNSMNLQHLLLVHVHVLYQAGLQNSKLLLLVIHTCRKAKCGYIVYYLCSFVLFVCTVTDFFAEDKASGIKFCTRRFIGVQGTESPIFENTMKPKIDRQIGQRSGHAYRCNILHEVGSACVDIGQSPLTHLF